MASLDKERPTERSFRLVAFPSSHCAPFRRPSFGGADGLSTETQDNESLAILRNPDPAQPDGALRRSLFRKSGSAHIPSLLYPRNARPVGIVGRNACPVAILGRNACPCHSLISSRGINLLRIPAVHVLLAFQGLRHRERKDGISVAIQVY
jgi:hypothetical protein